MSILRNSSPKAKVQPNQTFPRATPPREPAARGPDAVKCCGLLNGPRAANAAPPDGRPRIDGVICWNRICAVAEDRSRHSGTESSRDLALDTLDQRMTPSAAITGGRGISHQLSLGRLGTASPKCRGPVSGNAVFSA